MAKTLISFTNGGYKEVDNVRWKHSQWIHFWRADGSHVMVNPANVNYMENAARGTPAPDAVSPEPAPTEADGIPEMHVPGYGTFPVLRVYGPEEPLPDFQDTARFLVTKDGSSYQVPLNAVALAPAPEVTNG